MSTNIQYDQYAHIICHDYGFMPEPDGKYEPNWNRENDECYFTFAKARRGHNVIIKFHSDKLEKPPPE